MNKNNYCIIMAGGVGARFWPLSRSSHPKQFLDILGTGKTLIQQTFERFLPICPPENFFVVTNAQYKELVMKQLPELSEQQVLLEPIRRNTAPCIAYANCKIHKRNPNAQVIVTPSDHLIVKEQVFTDVLTVGLKFISENSKLLTLGIKPSRPETGYGYIQVSDKQASGYENIFAVKTFTEKPHYDLARIFFESGEFFWNSGIFLWSASVIREAFEKHLPEIIALFQEGISVLDTPKEQDFIDSIFPECQNISIDYGVLEKADNVFVLCADFGWSDLGTWGSLYEHSKKDGNQNAIHGKHVMIYESSDCIVNVPDNKLVIIQGLNDYIIVESNNSLLICKKQDEQEIRKIVTDVKVEKGEKYV